MGKNKKENTNLRELRALRGKKCTTRDGYPVEKRLRKLLKRHFAYWTGLLLTSVLREVPLPLCSWATSRVFLIWYYFFPKYRRRTQKHLRQAFGASHDDRWYRRVTKTMFMNLGCNLAEFLHIPRMPRPRFLSLVDGVDFTRTIEETLGSGKGALCVTGHIGNWELLAAYCAKFFPTTVIAKRIYFEKYDREVVKRRKRLGIEVVYQDEGLRPIMEALHANSVIGMLADQNLPDAAGVMVDFLGKEAHTVIAPAAIALKSKTPLFVVCVERLPHGKHRINITGPVAAFGRSSTHSCSAGPAAFGREQEIRRTGERLPSAPVEHPHTGNREADRLELTRKWNEILTSFIREHPTQWVWFHRRWRRRKATTPS